MIYHSITRQRLVAVPGTLPDVPLVPFIVSAALHLGAVLLGVAAMRPVPVAVVPAPLELVFDEPRAAARDAVEPAPEPAPPEPTPPESASPKPAPPETAPPEPSLPEPAPPVPKPSTPPPEPALMLPRPVAPPPSPARVRPAAPRPRPAPLVPSRPAPRQADPQPATSAPTLPARPAPALPVPATAAASAAPVDGAWRLALAAWVQSRKRYPDAARRDSLEGQVSVRFTVGRDGQVLDAAIAHGSGSDLLDAAALAMFRGARAPAFPPDMTQATMTTTVRVHFRLEE